VLVLTGIHPPSEFVCKYTTFYLSTQRLQQKSYNYLVNRDFITYFATWTKNCQILCGIFWELFYWSFLLQCCVCRMVGVFWSHLC